MTSKTSAQASYFLAPAALERRQSLVHEQIDLGPVAGGYARCWSSTSATAVRGAASMDARPWCPCPRCFDAATPARVAALSEHALCSPWRDAAIFMSGPGCGSLCANPRRWPAARGSTPVRRRRARGSPPAARCASRRRIQPAPTRTSCCSRRYTFMLSRVRTEGTFSWSTGPAAGSAGWMAAEEGDLRIQKPTNARSGAARHLVGRHAAGSAPAPRALRAGHLRRPRAEQASSRC